MLIISIPSTNFVCIWCEWYRIAPHPSKMLFDIGRSRQRHHTIALHRKSWMRATHTKKPAAKWKHLPNKQGDRKQQQKNLLCCSAENLAPHLLWLLFAISFFLPFCVFFSSPIFIPRCLSHIHCTQNEWRHKNDSEFDTKYYRFILYFASNPIFPIHLSSLLLHENAIQL